LRPGSALLTWVETGAVKVNAEQVRSVVEDQQFLSIELIEWKQLVAGVPYKLVPTLEALPSGSASQSEDQAPAVKDENAQRDESQGDEDQLMSDYEIELLGRAFIVQCRMAGIMDMHSPRGQPEDQPDPKRPQRRPTRLLSVSTPSEHFLGLSSNANLSVDSRPLELRASSEDRSGSFRSMVAPSGSSRNSPMELSSGGNEFRNSSSSSMMSMGHSASTHMIDATPGARVMSIQVAGGLNDGMDAGGVLTRTMIPSPAEVSYEADVEMESGIAVEGRESPYAPKGRPSGLKAAAKVEHCEPVFSESSRSVSNTRHSSVSSGHNERSHLVAAS
jgi:hypothetical protein